MLLKNNIFVAAREPLISIIFVLIFISCSDRKGEDEKCTCLPEIVIEAQEDTLSVGDEYIAKTYSSDESLSGARLPI